MKLNKKILIAKRNLLIGSSLACLLVIALPLYILNLMQPAGGTAQAVTIPEGTGKRAIAELLVEKRLIRSQDIMMAAMLLTNQPIKAGMYTIDPSQSTLQILQELSSGKETMVSITIPEGWRREQIARHLTEKGLDGAGFLALTSNKEGYLFPDTYYFPKDATAQQIVNTFSKDFTTRTSDLALTPQQVILASIVEREAKNDSDRPIIAGIYRNRISQGMLLEADPTVQYARDTNELAAGKTDITFWQAITMADYKGVISPYNTYLHSGYPPGPICNPGLKSLEAAAQPAQTDALYFFSTPDGRLFTSKTYEEHRAKVNQYLK